MPKWMRMLFKFLNRYMVVPIFRLGLGPVMTNPFSGYIMVMKTVGRKTGRIRYVPVNYTIWKGNIYCLSGGRESADWYKNLVCHPEIEIILPGGAVYGKVVCPYLGEERFPVIKQVLRNAGFAGFFEGYNPYTIGDEELTRKTADVPVIQIIPIGVGGGPADPQGWAWILWTVIAILIIAGLVILF